MVTFHLMNASQDTANNPEALWRERYDQIRKQERHALLQLLDTLGAMQTVPGRLEAIPNQRGLKVFVDYAHTPDALKNVLAAVREFSQRRVIVVFGCGGEREVIESYCEVDFDAIALATHLFVCVFWKAATYYS